MEALKNITVAKYQMAQIMFSWYDYALFTFMLLLSALIGVYFGCFGKKQTTANEYLLGGKTMKPLPIAMSLVASTVSGIALLAIPADVYRFGATYWLSCITIPFTCLGTCYIYLPVLHKLQITSTYEYLKLRFDTRVRVFASFLNALSVLLYLPIVIYVPALALSQATNINIHLITPVVCGVCIFYTTIGGLKAVVWTDMLQFSVTIGAMITVLYLGIDSAGGITAVLQKSYEGERLDIDFDWRPTTRDTFWAIMIGWTITSISIVAIGQGSVQKFLSVATMREAKITVLWFLVGIIVVKAACVMTGLIIYTKYSNCDPFLTQRIDKADQLLPYYVMDVAGKIPGLPGLFIAGVFCAALSTLSASMNSLAGTLYEDFVSRFMPKDITQKSVSNILKLIVIIIGIVSTSLVFIVKYLGSLLQISIAFGSITSGPLLGLFTLGMLFPRANSKGAFYGSVVSLIFISWMALGAQWYQAKKLLIFTPKPASTEGCDFQFTPRHNDTVPSDDVFFIYRISYYYYAMLSAIVVILVGYPISLLTQNEEPLPDKELLSPVVHFLYNDKKAKKSNNYLTEESVCMINATNKKIINKP